MSEIYRLLYHNENLKAVILEASKQEENQDGVAILKKEYEGETVKKIDAINGLIVIKRMVDAGLKIAKDLCEKYSAALYADYHKVDKVAG